MLPQKGTTDKKNVYFSIYCVLRVRFANFFTHGDFILSECSCFAFLPRFVLVGNFCQCSLSPKTLFLESQTSNCDLQNQLLWHFIFCMPFPTSLSHAILFLYLFSLFKISIFINKRLYILDFEFFRYTSSGIKRILHGKNTRLNSKLGLTKLSILMRILRLRQKLVFD